MGVAGRDAASPSDCYTLLADASSDFASRPEFYRGFKAHVVLNTVLNDGVVFSDNQAICAANLRRLVRDDEMVRQLFVEKHLGLAIRQGIDEDPDEIPSMAWINDAFEQQGKIGPEPRLDTGLDDLAFMERHARLIPWPYQEVRANFTRTSEAVMRGRFRELLGDRDYDVFEEILRTERTAEPDSGLGRALLQDRLPVAMAAAGIGVGHDLKAVLKTCTDAAYVSNLPATIGLNPIYSQEHAASFSLLRGGAVRPEDIDEARPVPMKLDHRHFIEGVNWLDLDDVQYLRTCSERRTYMKMAAAVANDAGRLDDVALAYVELNKRIEDRIIQRRPELRVHSPEAERRKIRKQVMRRVDYGMEALDCLGLGWELEGALKMAAVMTVKVVFDVVRARIEGDGARPFLDAAKHDLEMKRLRDYLAERDTTDTLVHEEQVIETSSFDKEIIVS